MRADPRLVLAGIAAALGFVVAGCGGRAAPVTIGVLADCVGPVGAYDDLFLADAELPLLERGARLAGPRASDGVVNASVAGRRVHLVSGCTEFSVYSRLIAEVRQLVEKDHANIIIGPLGAPDGLVVRDYARRHPNVVFLLTYSTAQEATLHDPAPNVFRFEPDGAQWVAGLGGYAFHVLGWRNVATVAENSSVVWPEVAGFVAEFCSLGGHVVDPVWTRPYVPPHEKPQLPAYTRKVPADVDGVALFSNYYQDTIGFARAYSKDHSDLAHSLIIGPSAFGVLGPLRRSGHLLEGVVTGLNQPFESNSPAFRAYARGFRKFFPHLAPQPSAPSDHLFAIPYRDAMEAALEALESSHADLSQGERAFRAALSRVVLQSPNGRISLDRHRQAIAPAYLSRVELDSRGRPLLRTLRVVPNVEQTFGGYFNGTTPPPSSVSPTCRRAAPPPWARS